MGGFSTHIARKRRTNFGVCLFAIPIYPCKVHVMGINELEAFLEFQAKISKNNSILGKNVMLWVHFHPASMAKVNAAVDSLLLHTLMKAKMAAACAYDVTHWNKFPCRKIAVVYSQNK
jgi:hypothetical protein